MKNEKPTKLEIDDISQINIHHFYDAKIPVCNIIQLDSGIIAIGLSSGNLIFFSATNLDEPYLCLGIDKFPIYSLLQIEDDQLICSSGQNIYLLFDTKKDGNFDKKEKIQNENLNGNVNKIISTYDKSIIIGDDKYISLFQKDKKKLNFRYLILLQLFQNLIE